MKKVNEMGIFKFNTLHQSALDPAFRRGKTCAQGSLEQHKASYDKQKFKCEVCKL